MIYLLISILALIAVGYSLYSRLKIFPSDKIPENSELTSTELARRLCVELSNEIEVVQHDPPSGIVLNFTFKNYSCEDFEYPRILASEIVKMVARILKASGLAPCPITVFCKSRLGLGNNFGWGNETVYGQSQYDIATDEIKWVPNAEA